jgi:alkanesulfonate monooxygenase SsuD/methylene tetrahydromethanopterin reductase-like flavin-dependent oxidoreductase (luciferase family)
MDQAQYHFTSRALSRINRDKGILLPLEAPDVAAAQPLSVHEQARMEQFRKDSFVGTGPEVAGRIRDLAAQVGVEEMAVVTWTHDEEVRRESYTQLARAFHLKG